MKRTRFSGFLAACLLGSMAFAASAQDAPPAEIDAEAEVQAQIDSDQQAKAEHDRNDRQAKADDEVDRNCLLYTGSYIKTRTLDEKGKDCVTANGRVYTREDIQRTGQTNIADALRMLDPSVF